MLVITRAIWLFNIAMENGPFIDGFKNLAIKNGDVPVRYVQKPMGIISVCEVAQVLNGDESPFMLSHYIPCYPTIWGIPKTGVPPNHLC